MCDGSPKLDCSQLTVSHLPAKSLSASPHNPLFGFLNVYKPQGITSHDVVARLRRLTKIRQIGHTGTLDPFAEGVLPICIGKATRLIEYLNDDKEYLATVQFGAATSTYDLEGDKTFTSDIKVSKEDVIEGLKSFEGEISQLPPIYSAIKVKGKKLYEYARNNEEVEIQPRKVVIERIELKSFNKELQQAEILIKCSKGTYIRSIAHDLGETVVPEELQYVEVIAVTDKKGNDDETVTVKPDGEEETELPETVTLLVTPEQANILAELEAEGEIHVALVYRGTAENAQKFISAQEKHLTELAAENEKENENIGKPEVPEILSQSQITEENSGENNSEIDKVIINPENSSDTNSESVSENTSDNTETEVTSDAESV